MDTFLETYNLPRLNHEDIEYLNGQITNKVMETVTKKLPTNQKGPETFTGEFYKTFKKELIPILPKLFQKIEEEGNLPNSFYEAGITMICKPDMETTKK